MRRRDGRAVAPRPPATSRDPVRVGGSLALVLLSLLIAAAGCDRVAAADWSDCAQDCRCRWSSGRKTALCGGAALRTLPHLHPDIQALDLTDSDLRSLPANAFSASGLIHLQRLGLRRARITTFHRDTFQELRILIEIDLSENLLERIPREAFRGNDRLRLLALNHNPLKELRDDQFPTLPQLKTIELRHCRLMSIHPRAFINLVHLETIDLRDNVLSSLAEATVDHLSSLKMLLLEGNPWHCDCRLRSFRSWYLGTRLSSEEPICREPAAVQGETWKNIEPAAFACAPNLIVSRRVVHAIPGDNVTLSCQAQGDPNPEVRWQFAGRSLSDSRILATFDEGDGWINVTLMNVSSNADGEYVCLAESPAGHSRASISLVMPHSTDAVGLEKGSAQGSGETLRGGLMLGTLCGVGLVLCCLIIALGFAWRMQRGRVPASRSFVEQQKKLLDGSLGDETERKSMELELREHTPVTEQSDSCKDVGSVRCEQSPFDSIPYVPPPPEFCALPCGNIFISVQVSDTLYPDLLGGSTLPRRTRPTCQPVLESLRVPLVHPSCKGNSIFTPTFDNMGPRVTVNGSSTWSLPGIIPPPPTDYVSL